MKQCKIEAARFRLHYVPSGVVSTAVEGTLLFVPQVPGAQVLFPWLLNNEFKEGGHILLSVILGLIASVFRTVLFRMRIPKSSVCCARP